jgi:ferredoxin
MKAVVDRDLCISCGLCIEICLAVFEFRDEKAEAKINPVPPQFEAAARDAAGQCPTEAIKIEE